MAATSFRFGCIESHSLPIDSRWNCSSQIQSSDQDKLCPDRFKCWNRLGPNLLANHRRMKLTRQKLGLGIALDNKLMVALCKRANRSVTIDGALFPSASICATATGPDESQCRRESKQMLVSSSSSMQRCRCAAIKLPLHCHFHRHSMRNQSAELKISSLTDANALVVGIDPFANSR